MPFKSEAQRRKFYAMAKDGEIPFETVRKWEKETKDGVKLPERVHKKKTKKASALSHPKYSAYVDALVALTKESAPKLNLLKSVAKSKPAKDVAKTAPKPKLDSAKGVENFIQEKLKDKSQYNVLNLLGD